MPAQRGTAAAAVFSAGTVVTPTNLAPTLPVGYQVGDALLCFTACRSATPTVATPAGCTSLLNVTGTNGRLALFGKIAASTSETAPTVTWSGLTTGNSGTPCGAQWAAFSGMPATIAGIVDILGTVENGAASTTAAAAGTDITTSLHAALVLSLLTRLDDAGTFTAPAGFAAVGATGTTSGSDFALAWAFNVRASAGSATVADWTLAGASSFASSGVQVALKPIVFTFNDSRSGAITAGGSGTDSYIPPTDYNDSRSGAITATGSGVDSWAHLSDYDAAVEADSPVSHWKLGTSTLIAVDRKGVANETTGSAMATASGLVVNNDGDLANTFTSTNGFAGPSSTNAGLPYNTSTWSVEAWCKPSTATSVGLTKTIVARSSTNLSIVGTNDLRLRAQDTSSVTYIVLGGTGSALAGQTIHVVGVYNGTDLILYRNGVEVGRTAMPSTASIPNNTPTIGAGFNGFVGEIDEVAWYSSALSSARVLAHYQAGLPATDQPVVTLVSQTRAKISRVSGYDSTAVDWTADKPFTDYQFRVVPATDSPVGAGVLIEQNQSPAAGGTASTPYTSTLTDAEVEAVSPAEGAKIVKLFTKGTAGTWSA